MLKRHFNYSIAKIRGTYTTEIWYCNSLVEEYRQGSIKQRGSFDPFFHKNNPLVTCSKAGYKYQYISKRLGDENKRNVLAQRKLCNVTLNSRD